MSFKDSLIQHFKSQKAKKPIESESPVKMWPPVILENFLEISLRLYDGYEGINYSTGERVMVPARYKLFVQSSREFAKALQDQNAAIGDVRVSGIDLDPGLVQDLEKVANQCRQNLRKTGKAILPEITDLRIVEKDTGRRVLTCTLESDDPEHPNLSPLLAEIEEAIN